ncbi:MAG TPA: aminopeptidase P family protein [Bacteroidales bacterium]|nr:aminopeptidase P family protein [Bacteroidales bacterium]
MNIYAERLAILRRSLKESEIDYLLIPSSDPHMGEYIPEHWRIIAWLTGFTGSAGTVIVSESFAGLWTDSRYHIQAEYQLRGSGFMLVKQIYSGSTDYVEWLTENMSPGQRLGVDGRIVPVGLLRKLVDAVDGGKDLVDTECDIITDIWTDRPPMPSDQAFDLPVGYAGKERSEKISAVREEMKKSGVTHHLLTSPDDIMWLLNIRGNDVKYTPLLMSFALVADEQVLLFVEESKVPYKLAAVFDKLGIVMLPYEETAGMLSTIEKGSVVLLNPATVSASLYKAIPGHARILEDISIPTRMKSVKNKVEISNIEKAMISDGVALTRFFHWVESNIGTVPMSELSLTEKLNHFRLEQQNCIGPSFNPIIAYNEHAALPHYSATSGTDSVIGTDGILLVDSGGQYLGGTTDITRTIALGIPTVKQKRDFTLVLKGTIGLALMKFPYGTRGVQLDVMARKALWDNGLNYGHGTGHGVGFCLSVHEGPMGIAPGVTALSKTVLEPGILISDEPGLYREGEYGIRTENLIICYEDEVTEFGRFLRFHTSSLCYIDKSLIDEKLLTQEEKDWLNKYHEDVFGKLSPLLTDDEKKWLLNKTGDL